MWVRMHKKPKICRKDKNEYNAKEDYYFNKSYARYSLTDDGIRIAKMRFDLNKEPVQEIGYVDNFNFICLPSTQ